MVMMVSHILVNKNTSMFADLRPFVLSISEMKTSRLGGINGHCLLRRLPQQTRFLPTPRHCAVP